jgi:hypothetical protein
MFADTLFAAERGHVDRLIIWAVLSIIAGIGGVVLARRARPVPDLLHHFAIQTGAWGVVNLVIALIARQGLQLRDYTAMVRLDRFLWFNNGLDVGYIAVGITLAVCGWRLQRRGLVGAGLGVSVQGLVLLLLDLRLSSIIASAR